jgi:Rod binding domain-containing protein
MLAAAPRHPDRTVDLHRLAEEMETAFLSEMLDHAGLGETSASFGGGVGEAQFASFLRHEQAQAIVASGGIGLAESLFRAMAQGQA